MGSPLLPPIVDPAPPSKLEQFLRILAPALAAGVFAKNPAALAGFGNTYAQQDHIHHQELQQQLEHNAKLRQDQTSNAFRERQLDQSKTQSDRTFEQSQTNADRNYELAKNNSESAIQNRVDDNTRADAAMKAAADLKKQQAVQAVWNTAIKNKNFQDTVKKNPDAVVLSVPGFGNLRLPEVMQIIATAQNSGQMVMPDLPPEPLIPVNELNPAGQRTTTYMPRSDPRVTQTHVTAPARKPDKPAKEPKPARNTHLITDPDTGEQFILTVDPESGQVISRVPVNGTSDSTDFSGKPVTPAGTAAPKKKVTIKSVTEIK